MSQTLDLRQVLQQIIVQEIGQPKLSGVQRQQHLQQLNRSLDELRHDAEAVHQHEVFGFPFGQLVAVMRLVGLGNSVKVVRSSSVDHRVVQLREQLVQGEGQLPSSFQQIERQLA